MLSRADDTRPIQSAAAHESVFWRKATSLPNTGPISLRNCCVLDQTGPVGVGGVIAHGLARGQAADPAPIYRPVLDKGVVSWARAKAHGPEEEEKAGAY